MSDQTSAPVPASPVVRIEIFGSTVSVNGVVILHDGSQPLHQVAIRAAADRVAKPLGRPVRAQATDAEGSASMVVHPDGRATDVVLHDEVAPAAPAAPVAPAAVAAAPVFSQVAGYPGQPADPTPTEPFLHGLGQGEPAAPARTASGGDGLPSRIVRMVAVAAALVAVVGMGVLLLGSRDDDGSGETTSATDGGSGETAQDPSPVAASESVVEVPGQDSTPELQVGALPGARALRLTLESTLYPTTAQVVVVDAKGKKVTREVEITDDSEDLDVDRLAAGTATWTAEVAGAPKQTGSVDILDTFANPTPTPTEAPVPAVDPNLLAAQEKAKAAKEAERAAKREAREARQQAREAKQQAQQKSKQQTSKKSTKKKSKTTFGKKKKQKTAFK